MSKLTIEEEIASIFEEHKYPSIESHDMVRIIRRIRELYGKKFLKAIPKIKEKEDAKETLWNILSAIYQSLPYKS